MGSSGYGPEVAPYSSDDGVGDETAEQLLHLAKSGERASSASPVSKVVLALSSLCQEMDLLVDEASRDFFGPLLFYGEEAAGSSDVGGPEVVLEEGDAALTLSRILPTLQRVACFGVHCQEVVANAGGSCFNRLAMSIMFTCSNILQHNTMFTK